MWTDKAQDVFNKAALAVELQDAYITALSTGKSVNQVWDAVAEKVLDLFTR